MNYRFIAVSGAIGAGKTELSKIIAHNIDARHIPEEFTSNSFLEKFYEDPNRYSFPLEISFLFERFQQLKVEFGRSNIFQSNFVSDYIFDQCLLFAKLNLTDDQFGVFKNLYYAFYEQLVHPDLIIYLHRPVESLLNNIRKRGRDFETGISYSYLDNIQSAYLAYLKYLANRKILILELGELDFVNNDLVAREILELSKVNYKSGINLVRLVG
jgi:deoxyguanosine kinase